MGEEIFKKHSEELEKTIETQKEEIAFLKNHIRMIPNSHLLNKKDIDSFYKIILLVSDLFTRGFNSQELKEKKFEINKILNNLVFNRCRQDILRCNNQNVSSPEEVINHWKDQFPELNWNHFKIRE